MATNKTMSVKILLVNKTTADWATESTVISKGLPCVEYTTDGRTLLKIGDGTNTYANLPYVSDGSFQITNYYTKEEVDEQLTEKVESLGNVVRVKGVKATVGELPTTDNEVGDLWFVGTAGDTTDSFSEYVWTTSNTWEFLGRVQTDVDLSGYVQTKDFTPLVARVETLETNYSTHTQNTDIHITAEEREAWNNKVDKVEGQGLSDNNLTDELVEQITAATEKLENIDEGATAITVDTALSDTSTNPVENKAVKAAIDAITETSGTQQETIEAQQEAIEALQTDSHKHENAAVLDATTASYTTEDKTKLDGIEEGANKTVVDTALSDTSTNPVENKAVAAAIKGITDTNTDLTERVEAIEADYITSTDILTLNCTL